MLSLSIEASLGRQITEVRSVYRRSNGGGVDALIRRAAMSRPSRDRHDRASRATVQRETHGMRCTIDGRVSIARRQLCTVLGQELPNNNRPIFYSESLEGTTAFEMRANGGE